MRVLYRVTEVGRGLPHSLRLNQCNSTSILQTRPVRAHRKIFANVANAKAIKIKTNTVMMITLSQTTPAHHILLQLLQTLVRTDTGCIVIATIMIHHLQPLRTPTLAPTLSLILHGHPLLLCLKLLSTYLNASMTRVGRSLNQGKILWQTKSRAYSEQAVELVSL